jgi:hypothetical protein
MKQVRIILSLPHWSGLIPSRGSSETKIGVRGSNTGYVLARHGRALLPPGSCWELEARVRYVTHQIVAAVERHRAGLGL